MRNAVRAALLAACCLTSSGAICAAEKLVPGWMKIQAPARLVRLDIVAGWNANDGALNFNGYFNGDLTVVVPVGWTVDIAFKNNDGMLPHSLVVTRPFPPGEMPQTAGTKEVAIPRAYTNDPEQGIPAAKTDSIRFAAKEAGEFYMFCGAPGHGQGGMWVKLKIDPAAETPYALVEEGADGRK
jgi:sulfocyanin